MKNKKKIKKKDKGHYALKLSFMRISPLHRESFVHLSADRGARPPSGNAPAVIIKDHNISVNIKQVQKSVFTGIFLLQSVLFAFGSVSFYLPVPCSTDQRYTI